MEWRVHANVSASPCDRYKLSMKTILFGNGLNRLNGYSTWEDLLVRIDDKEDKKDGDRIPNTLQYEAEILPLPKTERANVLYNNEGITYNDNVVLYSIDTEVGLKARIAQAMKSYQSNEIYQRIAFMPDVTHLVTTNYDEVMRHTLESLGYKMTNHVQVENTYSLRRCTTLSDEKTEKKIWNIHGEIASPKTIMLGLNQYCGSVGRISEYLSGKYTYSVKKQEQVLPSIQSRLRDGIADPFSWIDLFFISDIFILGFGLLYEEIDLWWILTRRKRLIRQGAYLHNHVYYCGTVPPGKRQLLSAMDVEVIEPNNMQKEYSKQYYHSLLALIEKIV